MEDRLLEAINNHCKIGDSDKDGIYRYLKEYIFGMPIELRRSLGTEKEIVDDFVKNNYKILHANTVTDCLYRLQRLGRNDLEGTKWFGLPLIF